MNPNWKDLSERGSRGISLSQKVHRFFANAKDDSTGSAAPLKTEFFRKLLLVGCILPPLRGSELWSFVPAHRAERCRSVYSSGGSLQCACALNSSGDFGDDSERPVDGAHVLSYCA
jgi:hypothetical protein